MPGFPTKGGPQMNTHTPEREDEPESQLAYCVYFNTVVDGPVPSVRNGEGYPFVFPTRDAAEREIADNAIDRLQEYLDGERDFDDAMTVEEYVVDVMVHPDGSISDEADNFFGKNS
jgi:hypothetical protein